MILRTLAEVVSSRQPVVSLVLKSSKDLICTNLFCERVSEPCVCRLDKILKMKKLTEVKSLDLSHNSLDQLPPSLSSLEQVEELNISGNRLTEIPDFVLSLPKLKILNVSGNIGIKLPEYLERGYKIEIITDENQVDRLTAHPI